jgi:LPS-assembly lipoprotein
MGMRVLAFSFLLFISACGFRPVHAPTQPQAMPSATSPLMQTIQVSLIPNRSGQILQTELEDLLHPDGQFPTPRYRLDTTLEETKQPIVIETNGRVSRYNLILLARYNLYEVQSNALISSGSVKRISGFNASLSDFSTFVSENDTHDRNLKQMAKDITLRLALQMKKAQP